MTPIAVFPWPSRGKGIPSNVFPKHRWKEGNLLFTNINPNPNPKLNPNPNPNHKLTLTITNPNPYPSPNSNPNPNPKVDRVRGLFYSYANIYFPDRYKNVKH